MRKEKSKSALQSSQSGYGTADRNGEEERNGRISPADHDPLMDSFDSTDSQLSCADDDHHTENPTYLSSPSWWGGFVLMTVGEIGNFLAYGFAPASIVSPLGVVALISNCMIAPIMLKERFRQRDFWGVVVAVAGAVTVVLSAKQEEKKLGPHEILDAVTRTEFEVYMGITMVLIGTLLWASPRYGKKTILIDLGLVGLFGTSFKLTLIDFVNSLQVDIQRSRPKALHLCYLQHFGELSQRQLRTSFWPYSSALLLCR